MLRMWELKQQSKQDQILWQSECSSTSPTLPLEESSSLHAQSSTLPLQLIASLTPTSLHQQYSLSYVYYTLNTSTFSFTIYIYLGKNLWIRKTCFSFFTTCVWSHKHHIHSHPKYQQCSSHHIRVCTTLSINCQTIRTVMRNCIHTTTFYYLLQTKNIYIWRNQSKNHFHLFIAWKHEILIFSCSGLLTNLWLRWVDASYVFDPTLEIAYGNNARMTP